ncbi:flagellar hook assembly protein FlgD [Inquilinus limosus]|uniref:flagellar hook assembly protein FlgD n=1 Tax=Inquilinus limosus TaxID=171674 RepID=UPI0003FCC00A|nr:flagellar hook assembly protein FlgD [Inquilinus limosus]
MAVDPVSSTQSTTPQTATDYQTFLKLLTAQLKNQDPLAPMDATQFVSQLATFSQVEQLVSANKGLTQLVDATTANTNRLDLAYLGRSVEAQTDRFSFDGSSAALAYAVGKDAKSVEIQIKSPDGTVIRHIAGDTAEGRHEIAWDGARDDGGKAPAGAYLVEAVAKSEAGDAVDAAVVVTDTVKEVIFSPDAGSAVLLLKGGGQVRSADVLKVSG